MSQQAEFALGSWVHQLTPSKTLNTEQGIEYERLAKAALAEARAAGAAAERERLVGTILTQRYGLEQARLALQGHRIDHRSHVEWVAEEVLPLIDRLLILDAAEQREPFCDHHDLPLVGGWHILVDPEGVEGDQRIPCPLAKVGL